MPTLYWGPWLAKIRRGGPATGKAENLKNFILVCIYIFTFFWTSRNILKPAKK